ncbi:MAG: response regulator, partial [Clostridiales bacterium]|nr:response regulator [Clostridiales bacterium]
MADKILIIEDDEQIITLERDYLEANGFQTELEMNGEQGLEKALRGEYKLILLDLMLPDKDVFEICVRKLSQKKTTL